MILVVKKYKITTNMVFFKRILLSIGIVSLKIESLIA